MMRRTLALALLMLPALAVAQSSCLVDVCILFDGSLSAQTTRGSLSAQAAITRGVAGGIAHPDSNIAVVQFASTAWTLLPPTVNGNLTAQLLDSALLGLTPNDGGSAPGQGVAECTAALMALETGLPMRILLFLAGPPDGDNSTLLIEEARAAKATGVEIIAIGPASQLGLLNLVASTPTKVILLVDPSNDGIVSQVAGTAVGAVCSRGECQIRSSFSVSKSASAALDRREVKRMNVTRKIINGAASGDGQYSFVGRMLTQHADGLYYPCTVSLIHPYVLLTAAHCVQDDAGNLYKFTSVRVGATNFYCPGSAPKRSEATAIIPHPRYKDCQEFSCFDVALIVLKEPIYGIKPVKLAQSTLAMPLRQALKSVGWGITDASNSQSLATQRLWATMYLTGCPKAGAISPYNGLPYQMPWVATEDQICADGGSANSNTCRGDSGGPLLLGEDTQVGISSWGWSNCRNEGMYTSIMAVKSWIDGTLSKLGFLPGRILIWV